jgi:hypothetical protein
LPADRAIEWQWLEFKGKTMNIAVPKDVESALTEEAAIRGKSPEELAVTALRDRFVRPAPPPKAGGTLADLLKGHIGVLSSGEFVPGGANLSENCGERFTDILVEKRKQGRL